MLYKASLRETEIGTDGEGKAGRLTMAIWLPGDGRRGKDGTEKKVNRENQ